MSANNKNNLTEGEKLLKECDFFLSDKTKITINNDLFYFMYKYVRSCGDDAEIIIFDPSQDCIMLRAHNNYNTFYMPSSVLYAIQKRAEELGITYP